MKKNRFYSFLCLLFITCTVVSCDDEEYEVYNTVVTIENLSNEEILVGYGRGFKDGGLSLDPYGVFHEIAGNNRYYIQPDSSAKVPISYSNDKVTLKQDTYECVVFKQSTLEKYTTKQLVQKDIFDKHYVFLYKDLKKMNFKVTYTGD